MVLAALMIAAVPAAAQRTQQTQQAPAVLNNDLRLASAVNVEYRIDANWSFHLDTELRLDDNISRLRDFEVRPGFEYQFSKNWAVAAGYVQKQRYVMGLRPWRGPFQDILYRTFFERVEVIGRLRLEELFYEDSSLLGRARVKAGAHFPIGSSPWTFDLTDEVYLDLKVDGTGREAGLHHNKAYAGISHRVGAGSRISAGYELDTYNQRNQWRNEHTLKVTFAYSLN
jgi:hypothetical protein